MTSGWVLKAKVAAVLAVVFLNTAKAQAIQKRYKKLYGKKGE